jgi:hypothetical protein
VSSIIGTLARLGLTSVGSLCARVAWAIENRRVECLARRLGTYAPVSATRYFTGALVAMSRVPVARPALHRPRRARYFDATPATFCTTLNTRSPRRLPWLVDRKGGGMPCAALLDSFAVAAIDAFACYFV